MMQILLAFLLFSPLSEAHTTIVANEFLQPRTENPGLKEGPCGNAARLPHPMRHQPGATIRVDWKETKQHPGRFVISFSPARDKDFVELKTVPDNQDGSSDLPHRFSTEVKLPDTRCDDCTIQLIQVMTENPNRPKNYFSCADIILSN